MTTTANLKLPEIAESQAGKATTHNEALHVVDALLNCGVIDRDLTAPPGSPVNGDVYIPKATATGAWAGKENQLAQWDVTFWKFHVPEEGWRCYVRDEDALLVYTGSAWTVLAAGSAPFVDSAALVKGSADATKLARLEVDGLTTGTTRVLTVQDRDYTLAGTDDITAHAAAADPHTVYQRESEKGAANGYASLDSGTLIPAAQLPALVGDSGSGGTKGAAPAPAAGDAAAGKFLKADGTWAAVSGAAGGTVTSVALTVPAELSVAGSPITASGTLAVTKANQSANQVYAGPTSGGAAAPAFRSLVAADIPAQPYDVGSFLETAPTASQVVLRHVFSRQVIFASGLSPSAGAAGTAATAQTDFDIQKNGSSVGTMRFAASGTTASFIMASQTTFSAGDVVKVVASGTPDATLAQITFTLAGTR